MCGGSCTHVWKEDSRREVPPDRRDVKGDPEMALKMASGFTVILLQCQICGEIESREVHGNTSVSN